LSTEREKKDIDDLAGKKLKGTEDNELRHWEKL
jgi:hypothetical protein